MRICINCLGVDGPVIDYPIGNETGPQMDPTRKTIPLCPNCRSYLESGDMKNFHLLYSETRKISYLRRRGKDNQDEAAHPEATDGR